jgi:transcriptional regulator with XRE-family HTH domain
MIGEELKKARGKAGLSQEELASRAGVHRTYISLLERNKKSPTLDTLIKICKALEVSASKIIARVERAKT